MATKLEMQMVLAECMQMLHDEADFVEPTGLANRLRSLAEKCYDALGKPTNGDIDRIKRRYAERHSG